MVGFDEISIWDGYFQVPAASLREGNLFILLRDLKKVTFMKSTVNQYLVRIFIFQLFSTHV